MKDCSVFILCGGKGRRLKERTQDLPKPLIEVAGRPMLEHIIQQYYNQGFTKIVLATGHLSHKIEEFSETLRLDGLELIISNAGEEASMLERIDQLKKHSTEQNIVSYGDTFLDLDFKKLVSALKASQNFATIVTGNIRNPFGIVKIDQERQVLSFDEKPLLTYYIGSFCFQKNFFDLIDQKLLSMPDGSGLVELFQNLTRSQRLGSFSHEGLKTTFNTEPELYDADKMLREFYTIRESHQ